MADRQIIPEPVSGFPGGESRFPPRKARPAKEISEGPGSRLQPTCINNPAGISVRAYPPVNRGRKKRGRMEDEWRTGYFRTGADGVFTPAPAFGWSFRYSSLCDPRINAFTCFAKWEITFGTTVDGCALVPDPDFWGAVSCIFVSVIVVSCVVVFFIYVQLLFIIQKLI